MSESEKKLSVKAAVLGDAILESTTFAEAMGHIRSKPIPSAERADLTKQRHIRDHLLALAPGERQEIFESLDGPELKVVKYDWAGIWARDEQLPPEGDWQHWLILAGRGFGKTRTGAEWVRWFVEKNPGCLIGLIGETAAAIRDVMVQGESGIENISPPWNMPKYQSSKKRLVWPNGSIARFYSSENPEQLRGPQFHGAWGDEPASWQNADSVWSNLKMCCRLPPHPRIVITGTPKPHSIIKTIKSMPATVVTRGSTFDNAANLADVFVSSILQTYGGTRIGRQELEAEELEDEDSQLFRVTLFDEQRVEALPEMERVIVAVDPAPTSHAKSDETGIMVVGKGSDGHAYVIEDCSINGTPDEWASQIVRAYHRHKADKVIAEINNGGEMVEYVIRSIDQNIPFEAVRAMRGKSKRAEPVAAMYEQRKVHHLGPMERLEKQMTKFTGLNGRRDDRTDAMCWGIHFLFFTAPAIYWT